MVTGMGKKLSANPFLLIGIFVGLQILINVVTTLFPLLMTSIAGLGGLGNFTFASLFADNGLGEIILSAVVLLAVLAILGVKGGGGSKR